MSKENKVTINKEILFITSSFVSKVSTIRTISCKDGISVGYHILREGEKFKSSGLFSYNILGDFLHITIVTPIEDSKALPGSVRTELKLPTIALPLTLSGCEVDLTIQPALEDFLHIPAVQDKSFSFKDAKWSEFTDISAGLELSYDQTLLDIITGSVPTSSDIGTEVATSYNQDLIKALTESTSSAPSANFVDKEEARAATRERAISTFSAPAESFASKEEEKTTARERTLLFW